MPARKKLNNKAKKARRVTPCTDANQKALESIREKNRQRDALVKKYAEMQAQQMLAHQQRSAITGDEGESSTISALGGKE